MQIIAFDPSSGHIVHTWTEGVDVFASEEQALDAVRSRYGSEWSEVKRGCMIIGAVLAPPVIRVLLASEVRRDCLPGGNEVGCCCDQAAHSLLLDTLLNQTPGCSPP